MGEVIGSSNVDPMYSEFVAWTREFQMGDTPYPREKRWTAIAQLLSDLDWGDIEALVRMVFKARRHPPAQTTVQKLRSAFQKADPDFPMQDNAREMEVLAGACLAILINRGLSDLPSIAALAVTTAAAGQARKPTVPLDLVGFAEDALDRLAHKNRERPDLDKAVEADDIEVDFGLAIEAIEAEVTAETLAVAFTAAAKATQSALEETRDALVEAAAAANNFIKMQAEELNMLWWLTGGRSFDFDCPFGTVPSEAQPLVFAKELAAFTELLPGPVSINGLLSRSGLSDRKKIPVTKVINGTDEAWLGKLVEGWHPSPVTQPLHFAIVRQLETGPNEVWVANWAATTEIAAEVSYTPLMLATLFYRERLLALFVNT